MRFLYLLLSLFLLPTISYTQVLDGQISSQTQNWHYDIVEKSRNPEALKNENIIGSQYFNQLFSYGKVLINNKELDQNFALRYNAYSDEIEVNNGVEVNILTKEANVSCIIDDVKYSYQEYFKKNGVDTQFGYLKTIFKGEKIILYHKETKRFKEGKKAKTSLTTSIPPKLVDFESFYFSKIGETPYKLKLKKKDLLAVVIPEHKTTMIDFIKSNHLKFKSKTDLITFFKYYESLLLNKTQSIE
jgi:hypothetical protein